jgi:hypothetical protein
MGHNTLSRHISKKLRCVNSQRAQGSFTPRRKPGITRCSILCNTSLHLPEIVKMDTKYVNALGSLSTVSFTILIIIIIIIIIIILGTSHIIRKALECET